MPRVTSESNCFVILNSAPPEYRDVWACAFSIFLTCMLHECRSPLPPLDESDHIRHCKIYIDDTKREREKKIMNSLYFFLDTMNG